MTNKYHKKGRATQKRVPNLWQTNSKKSKKEKLSQKKGFKKRKIFILFSGEM